jgi:hypothetical protein
MTMPSAVDFDDTVQPRGAGASAPGAASSVADLQISYLAPGLLRSASHNARTHSKKQLKQIARSIGRFGFVNPVLISDDFEIIAGHGRVEAAKLLDLPAVPTVRLSNLSPAERRAYVIADNRLAELAGWDRELLTVELQGLVDIEFDDVELTGFSLDEINVLRDAASTGTVDPAADEAAADRPRPVVSRPGDLWELGAHRLLCGDDPLSCDVMVRRWQHYTGKAARLAGAALTFAEAQARWRTEQSAPPLPARRK